MRSLSKNIWIMSNFEVLLTTLTGDRDAGGCRYWNGSFEEPLSPGETATYQFTADASHPNSKYVINDNKVIFKEPEEFGGEYRMFTIIDTELGRSEQDGRYIIATCEPAWYELDDDFIENIRPTDKTPQEALDLILAGTRYVGEVDPDLQMRASDSFYQVSAKEAVIQFFQTWGGYFKDTIEFDGNDITRRVIKSLKRRGAANGVRFEHDKDITGIRRNITGYPKTALYPYGASLEMTDEDGNATGGYTRYIDIKDVVWSKAAGDPVDKPAGQAWVGDPDLLKVFGRPMDDGSLRHRWTRWQNEDIKTPEELIEAAYYDLVNNVSKAIVNYNVEVAPKNVKLGDTCIVLDREFATPIELEADVIKMTYFTDRPEEGATIELGEYLDLDDIEKQIGAINDRFKKNEGKWNTGGGITEVTDGDFPDTKPPKPSNIVVKAMFQSVFISWDYNPASYIAGYRVYASKVKDFTPTDNDIIFEGKMSGYEHKVGNNELWYYRLSAVNYHETESDLSDQYSAQSVRIMTDDILFGSVIADKLANLAVTADKLSRNFDEGNIFPGSLLKQKQFYDYTNSSHTVEEKTFNEMTIKQVALGSQVFFGVCGEVRAPNKINRMPMVQGEVYTLSFEIKRNNTTDINYIHLRDDGGTSTTWTRISGAAQADISSYPSDQFVRVDIQFTAPATSSNCTIGIAGNNKNSATELCSFVIRKVQVRKGTEIKDYGYSPYDIMLTDGAIYGEYIQAASINSAHIAEAAIGSAAIQNAAIKNAHLGTAIVDTANIKDAAITSAKIKELSADLITSGTINAINITGSLIRGGRFEPLNESSAYTSYIEGDKIYQRVNTVNYGGTPEKTYSDLTITSGDITLAYGGRDTGTDEPLRTLRLRDGSIYMSGNINDAGYAEQQMFCNDDNILNAPKAIYRQRLGGVNRMILHSYYDSIPKSYNVQMDTRNSGVYSHFADMWQLTSDGGIMIMSKNGRGIHLDPCNDGTAGQLTLNVGNAGESGSGLIKPVMAGEPHYSITDIHGALQTNMVVMLYQQNFYMPSTGDAYASVYSDISPPFQTENIFMVVPTVFGSYSDHVHATITSQSSTGFRCYIRGTGSSTAILGRTFPVRFVIYYEVI
ncbi:minor head protein [Bacillus phage 000TH010]|uniref:Tail tip protein n=1 Tax=Bacillus phage 000TH010 TaxID=2601652 RepID=A0A5P8PJJ5_9CAUD|nr:minor head protein [Bacillus phage 000TH010]QFR56240.1 tail tip protein [Bacillus phage 000TH010]